MAKKKRQKRESKKGFGYKRELQGLLLVLLSLVGLGNFGVVGDLIRKFSILLFGSWWFLILGLFLFLGVYLIIKRHKPNYFTARLIGIYALILALLLYSHITYIEQNSMNIKSVLNTTYNNITEAYESENEIRETGGGMIGAVSSWAFVSLFDIEGTNIVMIVIASFGVIMLFDLTISELIKTIFKPIKKLFSSEDDYYEDDDEAEDDVKTRKMTKKEKKRLEREEKERLLSEEHLEKDNKLVITSVEDLNQKFEHKEENTPIEKDMMEEDYSNEVYIKPSTTLLNHTKNKSNGNSTEYITNNKKILERVFQDFGMHAKVIEVHVGPAVTQYEMNLDRGTKVNKVLSISREIALALAAKEVRIEAPIPGKNTVGVEIPNQTIMAVSMREIMESKEVTSHPESKLLAPLGRDIMGNVKCVEINKTPHMLVAGATGSGKSVCINNIILSILMRTTPEEVKMVLVDPKKVEFNVYEGIPHLLTPVVTDPKKASAALIKIVGEMDDRYETFKNSGTKNISTYNEYVEKQLKKNPDCGLKKMPFILVVIDELADLMLVAAKEVEESIMRITQLARAAGIHLIVATQRPSADIITGVIKSNIPTRISFAVSSSIDSRTILDMTGAEKLLGRGDMLYKPMDENTPTRVQGSFVGDDEIQRVVDFVKKNSHAPKYSEKFSNLDVTSKSSSGGGASSDGEAKDVLYDEILEYAIRMGQISASLIQRKYSIGYNRAARIIDLFEERGIVGPAKGSKPRDVLVTMEQKNDE